MIHSSNHGNHSAGADGAAGNHSLGISAYAFPRCMDKEDVIAFEPERESRLLCTEGLLWATVQDDPNDYLLGRGRDLAVPGRRKLVIQAESPSCFEID
jgi:hypothetical protein